MLGVDAWLQIVRRKVPGQAAGAIVLRLLFYLANRAGCTPVVRIRLLLGHRQG